ncbi:hypothetical protein GW916_11505 [bacterium]|nr:hypothetical protein [bacterium]
MKTIILSIFLTVPALASVNMGTQPLPIFLKAGFSSVIEFDDAPIRVVLGDTQMFQVERVERSLVVRTLAPYAVTNLFVYFREASPKLFVLTASEDAEPSYRLKIVTKELPKLTKATPVFERSIKKAGIRILRQEFDSKKDYLTLGFQIAADSSEPLKPNWDLVRLRFGKNILAPSKLWAERKDVQRDSRVNARLVFAKPNLPRSLSEVSLVVPLQGKANALSTSLGGGRK